MAQNFRERLIRLFLVRSEGPAREPALVWTVLAVVSVAAATFIAMRPDQLGDLGTVREWLTYWITTRGNPYQHFYPVLDYPPIAFLLLGPLALVPVETLAHWFVPAAIALTSVAMWAQLRWIAGRLRIRLTNLEQLAMVAMVMCDGAARGSIWRGQTLALSLILGAFAMTCSRRRPIFAAVCLALCSFKLHIAAGYALAILLIDGASVPAFAVLITAALSWVFAATVGSSLVAISMDYGRNLVALYTGPDQVRGMLSIRFVLDDLIGWYPVATATFAVLAVGSLAAIVIFGRGRRADLATQAHVAVACILWSLVFLPHQLYDSLYAAPALFLLMWPESGLVRRVPWRAAAVGAYVMFGVLDLPRLFHFLSDARPESDLLFWLAYDLNPLRPALLFALVLWRLYRRTRAAPATSAA